MPITYRIATKEDTAAIYRLLLPYAKESMQSKGKKISKSNSLNVIDLPWHFKLLAIDGKKIVGVAMCSLMYTWWKRPEGGIDFFYLRPEYRGTKVAREMVKLCIEMLSVHKCGTIWTNVLSGINAKNDNMYSNLFKKFGFKDLGNPALVLTFEE